MRRIGTLMAILILTASSVAFAQEGTVGRKDALETTRADLQAKRKAQVEANLALTESEAQAFWPLYDEYQAELVKLGDRRSALITQFARDYEKLTDDQAKNMITESLDIQEQALSLRRATLKKMEGVVPPQKLARFLQIQNKFDAQIDYELAKMVPLAETK